MQKRIENWLSYGSAKPISWVIFAVWLALKYTCVGGTRCINRLRQRWATWRRKPNAESQSPLPAPSRRIGKREAVQR